MGYTKSEPCPPLRIAEADWLEKGKLIRRERGVGKFIFDEDDVNS